MTLESRGVAFMLTHMQGILAQENACVWGNVVAREMKCALWQ